MRVKWELGNFVWVWYQRSCWWDVTPCRFSFFFQFMIDLTHLYYIHFQIHLPLIGLITKRWETAMHCITKASDDEHIIDFVQKVWHLKILYLTPKEVLGYNSCCLYMSRDDMHHQLRLETCRVLEWGKFSNCGVFYWTLFLHINDFTCLYCWFGYTSFLSLAYWTHLFELDTFSDKPLINMLTFNSILYYYNI